MQFYCRIIRRIDVKELYINGKLTLVIYDNDLKVASEEEDFESVSEYLQVMIKSNIDYDAVSYNNDLYNEIEWRIE